MRIFERIPKVLAFGEDPIKFNTNRKPKLNYVFGIYSQDIIGLVIFTIVILTHAEVFIVVDTFFQIIFTAILHAS